MTNRRRPQDRIGIFLDKDGTVLENVPYNVDPAQMRYAPRAEAALRRLGRLDVSLVMISNQPGIAHGYFDQADVAAVEERLGRMFTRCGAELQRLYFCPHHPDGKIREFACACLCRKPMPGLLRRAAVDHGIDVRRSWMVGDILDDVEAGRRAGCRTILIDNGNETEWYVDPRNAHLRTPDHVVPDLEIAARIISGSIDGPGRVLPRSTRAATASPASPATRA